MNRTAATLSPLAAAAFAFGALTMTAPSASAATTTSPYQQSITLDCSGSCSAKFPQLPANQAADLQHVACDIVTDGTLSFVEVALLPSSLNFKYPLSVTWQRKFFDSNVYTVCADVNIRVPAGRQAEIQIIAGGLPHGICAMTGTRLTSG